MSEMVQVMVSVPTVRQAELLRLVADWVDPQLPTAAEAETVGWSGGEDGQLAHQMWPTLTGTGKQLLRVLAAGDSEGPDGFRGEELADRLGLVSSFAVAGVVSGVARRCTAVGRALPFTWRETATGTVYHPMKPDIAEMFGAADAS